MKSNKTKENCVRVYIFYRHIPENLIASLNVLKEDGFDIIFKQLTQDDLDYMQSLTKQQPNSTARAWCGIVFARLWLAKHLLNEKRCLYLDSDTMVRGDIKDLYETDMKGKSYGMVMGCIPEYGYNSGVILMDLEKIRAANKWVALNEHLEKYAKTYFLPDQTVFNRFYKDDIFELPLKYNYPPCTDRFPAKGDECSKAIIWHFYNGGSKPFAFSQADWCKVEWNKVLGNATAKMEANKVTK